uniref:Actin filament-associated protein 1-like 2 n=1 Tax=Anabas testudineus TaxID=64144 RepID=A0A3Q1J8N8_ANATE
MEKHKVLDQLLMELHRFLLLLDKETLSGNATVQKGLLADLLKSYSSSNGADEEYIYMNKVLVPGKDKDKKDDRSDTLNMGKTAKYVPVPQKILPDLPTPRTGVVLREPFPLPPIPSPACIDTSESYYEEAQPYEETINDDGEAVSSSYESYDEEEVTRGKSAQHQWPSAEASIELMKDATICAFLWRKKWLGQWAKQLCVIKDHRLLCYKSSKEQTPLLDVSLLGCSVVYKEKQPKRKEHKLKIIPVGGEAIVLGLQSKEQTEQWLKVIQEISPKPAESCDSPLSACDSPRLICTKGELSERHSGASESGSSTDSHIETPESKDVKKKYGPGLMFSNLMNIGKRKLSSLESSEKCVDTSGYLNVFVNSHWQTCWCLIKNGQLWFYQDKGKKVSQPAVTLEGCSISPDPSPEHLYSFKIDMDGTQLATLEAKTSEEMGHWLGLLLSQTGSKTDPEDLTYDYVNAERISSIVNAAKTSLYFMQRRYSEPNTYIDAPPPIPHNSDDLYDDVASLADPEDNNLEENKVTCAHDAKNSVGTEQDTENRIYLDLIPVRSFLHTSGGSKVSPVKETHSDIPPVGGANLYLNLSLLGCSGAVEVKLGKNRTEADLRRYIDERDCLEKEREEVRSSLANLRKERKEIREEISACQDSKQQALLEARLKQKEEECRVAEHRRVEVELHLVEVKENLKKVESGPFTLGTTLDSSRQDTSTVSVTDSASPVNSASNLKTRPTSMVGTKGNVMQKAKVRQHDGACQWNRLLRFLLEHG